MIREAFHALGSVLFGIAGLIGLVIILAGLAIAFWIFAL